MIVVNIYGGLGNQLFQYAAGRQLAEKNHTGLKLDVRNFESDKLRHYCLNHFKIEEKFFNSFDRTIIKLNERVKRISGRAAIYKERGLDFDAGVLSLGNNVYLDGYWQSEKYFKGIEDVIRREVMVRDSLGERNKLCLNEINAVNAVSIHVRRGDYVTNSSTNEFHGTCEGAYYKEAIQQISSRVTDPKFFIFSDDIKWTKENLSTDPWPSVFVDHNQNAEHEDLRLMYSCKHHIVANSSFSWWGAWLNNDGEKIVIAPKRWFRTAINNDVVPEGWLKM